MKELTIDEVFNKVGHFGYGQILYISALAAMGIFLAFHMVLNIFTGEFPLKCYCHSIKFLICFITIETLL